MKYKLEYILKLQNSNYSKHFSVFTIRYRTEREEGKGGDIIQYTLIVQELDLGAGTEVGGGGGGGGRGGKKSVDYDDYSSDTLLFHYTLWSGIEEEGAIVYFA